MHFEDFDYSFMINHFHRTIYQK